MLPLAKGIFGGSNSHSAKGGPMRSAAFHLDQPIPLSKIRASYHARNAVLDGMPLDKFLLWRLRIYQAQYRRSPYPLPSDVVIEQGAVIEIVNAAYDPYWQQSRDDPTGEDAGVPFLTELEREELARKLEELEEEVARNQHRRQEASDQMEALAQELDEAIREGAVLSPTTQRRGGRRPRLPVPWMPVLGYTAIASMTLFEGYQLALPYLDAIGVDTTHLAREWVRSPMGIVSGAGFALASSVGLFLLWHLVLRQASLLFKSWQSAGPVMIALRVAGIVGLSGILLAGTYALATMRHGMVGDVLGLLQIQQGQPAGAGMGQSVFFFLTLLVPFAAAYIHHRMGQSPYWMRRRDILLKQAQWDLEEEQRVLAAERLADRRRQRQQEREEIERQRTQLQNQRQALAVQTQADEGGRQVRLDQAQHSTKVYARSLLAALEQDRYYFIRAANRCQAGHLVPEQARDHAGTQPPRPFVNALLAVGRNGHES